MIQAARRVLLAILLPALLLAQALGMLHATLHVGSAGEQPAAIAHVVASTQGATIAHAADAPHAAGWIADLFSSHGDAPSCRLYDQLAHGDAVAVPAPSAVVALTACRASPFFLLPFVAYAGTAGFHARGPPALR